MRALPRLVADTPPGEAVDVTVMRDGERVTLKIEVGLLEDEEVAAAADEPERRASRGQAGRAADRRGRRCSA